MECSIYALGEIKKKRRREARSLLVLARSGKSGGEEGEKLILVRDERNALWMLPGGVCQQGEDETEAVRRILGDALGEAVFDVRALCGLGETEGDGKERAGRQAHAQPGYRGNALLFRQRGKACGNAGNVIDHAAAGRALRNLRCF